MTYHSTAWVPNKVCPTRDFDGFMEFRSHMAEVTLRIPGGGGHDGYAFHCDWVSLTIEEARALCDKAKGEAHVRTYIEVWDGDLTFVEGDPRISPANRAARAWGCEPEVIENPPPSV